MTTSHLPIPTVDVAVVGAGPAGIAAAVSAREAGASVAVIDRYPAIGSQIWKRAAHFAGVLDDLFRPGPGLAELPDPDIVLAGGWRGNLVGRIWAAYRS
jgi:NADPH-dependent 2,4-dienoyl-CoA reductase/sulfur reductase-like enzyme